MTSLQQTIRDRHTLKVLADVDAPWPLPDGDFARCMEQLLAVAACAPFHYPSDASHHVGTLDSPVPWRFHVLDATTCRGVLKRLQQADLATGKVPQLLAAANATVLVTWLPDPPEGNGPLPFQGFAPTLRNMEHIAAASAAVQNLLLLATDAGFPNYWSSGGTLRSESAYGWLGIPVTQVLLGSIFLFPQDIRSAATKPGANHAKQGEPARWMRWAHL